jgi:7,8-dihydropterin-6-yl-methyl-4-(beta-D-ribofuranosyl)aminobenzene 5'-phosphate synthase
MVKITCVTDNVAAEESGLRTEHGVAFWIAADGGNVLFDTGASAEALQANLRQLGLRIDDIDAMALSHAHYDHTGGIEAVLGKREGLAIYANADIFRPKYSKHDGNYDASGFVLQAEDYQSRAEWHLQDEPTEIVEGLWTTGRIIEREYPEGRSAGHFVREDGDFVPDPYLDDMSLVLKTDAGLVLICGCCHAGILNTLAHARSHFEGDMIAILGGIHLMPAEMPMIRKVISALQEMAPNARFWLNHCTGDDAQRAFAEAFGEQAHHFKAGESIRF